MTKMQQVIPGGSEFSFHRLYLSPDDPGGGSESDNDSDDGSSDDDSNGDSDQGDGDSGSSSEDEGDSGIRMNITKEDLDKRLERASKRQVKALAKSFGFNDPEEFKKNVEAWKKADAEAKKKADAEKSDLEKAQARLAELEAADKAKGAEVAKLKLTIEIKDAAAKSGVKDPEIAEALYLKHRQDKGDEAQDPDEFYEELKTAKPSLFGEAKEGETKTSTGTKKKDKKPDENTKTDVLKMSDEDWKKYKQEHGF